MGKTIIQLLNDTASNWTSENPVLALGEMGIENDTDKFKFGDGSTAWNSLSYAGSPAGSFKYGLYTLSTDQTSRITVGNHIEFDTSEGSLGGLSTGSGQANGIITLAGGKTYKITFGFAIRCSSAGSAQLLIYDRTNSIGIRNSQVFSVGSSTTKSSMPYAQAIISPTADIDIDVRFNVLSNVVEIYDQFSSLLIEEYNGY